jgi:hypothetical protein
MESRASRDQPAPDRPRIVRLVTKALNSYVYLFGLDRTGRTNRSVPSDSHDPSRTVARRPPTGRSLQRTPFHARLADAVFPTSSPDAPNSNHRRVRLLDLPIAVAHRSMAPSVRTGRRLLASGAVDGPGSARISRRTRERSNRSTTACARRSVSVRNRRRVSCSVRVRSRTRVRRTEKVRSDRDSTIGPR